MEINSNVKVESDLESTKHLAYHLCAVSEDLRESFSEDELGPLVTCALLELLGAQRPLTQS